jgi:hypothetical protein
VTIASELQSIGSTNACEITEPLARKIILLDDPIPPRLVITAAEHFSKPSSIKYAALSYCWGKIPFVKTTPTNIESLMTSIPWNELPETVRDAITVTRRFQIRYLWVDSLCIIQGTSPAALSDWQCESPKMHDIYGGAFITIAVSNAKNAHEGLFRERPVELVRSCPLRLSSKYPGVVLLGANPPPYKADVEPLNTRGWALQEQILSSRILTYGTAGLNWMCRKSFHLETVPEPGIREFRFMEKASWLVQSGSAGRKLDVRDQEFKWVHVEWKRIIEDYSSRDLTYLTDRLPALYGISEVISRSSKDKYHAGLWRSDLVLQLLWRHYGKVVGSRVQTVQYSRAAQFRAPSWSWASVDGKVEFIQDYESLPGLRITCSLDTHTSQQLREMKKRPLQLFGVLRKMPGIRYDHAGRYYGGAERETDWISYYYHLRTYLDDLKTLPSRSILDRPDRPKQLLNPFFLFLGQKNEFEGMYFAGLILIGREKSSSTFRRVGVFEGFPDSNRLRKGDARRWVNIL